MKLHYPALVALCLSLGACATWTDSASPVQGETREVLLRDVPFHLQEQYHCGPAAIAMAAKPAGRDLHPDDIALLMMTPGKEGSLTSDLT